MESINKMEERFDKEFNQNHLSIADKALVLQLKEWFKSEQSRLIAEILEKKYDGYNAAVVSVEDIQAIAKKWDIPLS